MEVPGVSLEVDLPAEADAPPVEEVDRTDAPSESAEPVKEAITKERFQLLAKELMEQVLKP